MQHILPGTATTTIVYKHLINILELAKVHYFNFLIFNIIY